MMNSDANAASDHFALGDRITLQGSPEVKGTVRFMGPVGQTSGEWVGVEWDKPERGKHDGLHEGVRYFQARQPKSATFVRPKKIARGVPILQAIDERYGGAIDDPNIGINQDELERLKREMNAPFLELVGFDKVQQTQRDFRRLQVVWLMGMRVSGLESTVDCPSDEPALAGACPNVRDLDLSENLLNSWTEVARIGQCLPRLKILNVSDNRLAEPEADLTQAFPRLRQLLMGQMGYDWDNVERICRNFPQLEILNIFANQIRIIPEPKPGSFDQIKELDLSENPLQDWDQVLRLANLTNLTMLNLNSCQLDRIYFPAAMAQPFPALKFLQLSRNLINDWVSVGNLGRLSIKDLRMRTNPILESDSGENCRQIFIATISSLKVLNGSEIFKEERYGSEIDHLKRYGKEYLKAVADGPEATNSFFDGHPRFKELVKRFGPPEEFELKQVNTDIKSNLLEILIECPKKEEFKPVTKKVPKTMTVQKLRMLIYRLVKAKGQDLVLSCSNPDSPDLEVPLDNDLRELSFYSPMNTFGFLVSEAPGFALRGSQIKVLTEPAAFYNELFQRSALAQKRITLSALYLGTGEKEHRLVDKIHERVLQRDGLRVRVLLDYFRGNRLSGQGQSSCTMLQKLVQDRQEMCQISLYHTPVLRGLKKRIVPQKYNEMYGLQHTKVYIFDDSVIISGANLSQDYFTNRQDRYVLIKDCPELADYLDEVVGNISEFSFQMNSRCEFELHKNWHINPSEGDFNEYVSAVQNKVSKFLRNAKGSYQLLPSFYDNGREEDINTWEFLASTKIKGSRPSFWRLVPRTQASNLAPATSTLLLSIYRQYWRKLPPNTMFSWPTQKQMGSPNFGYRSVEKDLEAQVTIVTKDESLRTQLHEEQERLFETSSIVTDETFLSPERAIPYWVRLVVWSSRDFF
eukprot:TCALIF_04438-PA protein Name:"Similar to TBCE Tubulin-specific chaperone E (Pongo abelii)" AED:0.07 eAED:0.07 QI:119/0.4/0.16/1/0.6/0.66/6/0/917